MSQALGIFLSSTMAMLKLQIVIACGAILAMMGILTPEVAKGLNQLTFTLFVPCLLFTKVASSVSLQALESLFIVAIFAFINIFFGFALGYIGWYSMQCFVLPVLTRFKSPIIEISNLEMEEMLQPENGEAGPYRDAQIELEQGKQEIVSEPADEPSEPIGSSGKQRVIAAVAFGNATSLPLGLIAGIYPAAEYADELSLAMSYVAIYLAISQVLLYSLGYSFLSKGTDSTENDWKASIKRSLGKLLTPPTYALAIGCVVALIPAIKRLLYYDGGEVLFPNYPSISPPLSVISSAISTMADAAVPLMLLVLGANLSKGPGGGVSLPNLLLAAILKLIITPVFGILSVGLANSLGLIANNVMYLVLLIMTATPSAITLIVLTSILNQGEKQMSAILFYQYILSIATLTTFLFIFFYITGS